MRRCILALAFLALAGCAPDVHIHIYDDDGDDTDDTDDMLSTDSGFGSNSNASANNSNASASDTNASDSDPTTATDTNASDSDPTSATDTSDSDPTSATDTNASDSDPTEGDSSGGGVDAYPQPSNGTCPDGFGYNADGNFEFCGPECGEDESCPDTLTGMVQTSCIFNPDSSTTQCMSGMCESPEESCFAGLCMLPSTHCAVVCSQASAVCPDGMECSANSLCRFPT